MERDGNGPSLAEAIESDNLEGVKAAISAGADVNGKVKGMPALMGAAHYGNVEIVKHLLMNGAKADIKMGGATPLSVAEAEGHYEVAAILAGYTRGLWAAADYGIPESIRWLLENAPGLHKRIDDVDTEDHALVGNNALMHAAKHNELEMVKILLEYNADPSKENKVGEQAVDLATDQDVVDVLLAAMGPNPTRSRAHSRAMSGELPPSSEAVPADEPGGVASEEEEKAEAQPVSSPSQVQNGATESKDSTNDDGPGQAPLSVIVSPPSNEFAEPTDGPGSSADAASAPAPAPAPAPSPVVKAAVDSSPGQDSSANKEEPSVAVVHSPATSSKAQETPWYLSMFSSISVSSPVS